MSKHKYLSINYPFLKPEKHTYSMTFPLTETNHETNGRGSEYYQ